MGYGGQTVEDECHFHWKTYEKITVTNQTMVHKLRGYSSKHPKTWDESLSYLWFAFNRMLHRSSGKSPFEMCYGFLPPSLFDLVFTSDTWAESKEGSETHKAHRFLGKISQIHATVVAQLKKPWEKYKAKVKSIECFIILVKVTWFV